jgi:hypothetical protein
MDLKYIIAQQRRRPQSPSLDIAFALDKTDKSRRGPNIGHSRSTSATFVNENGIIVGKTTSTTAYTPSAIFVGDIITFVVPSGSIVGWLTDSLVSAHIDSSANASTTNDNVIAGSNSETFINGTIIHKTDTVIYLKVISKGGPTTTTPVSPWSIAYRGLRLEHDPITRVCKGALIEDPATNIAIGSENFHLSTSWSAVRLISQPASGENSPSNTPTAAKLVPNSDNDSHRVDKEPITITTSGPYVISLFVKPAGYTGFGIGFNSSSGGPNIKAQFSLVDNGSVTHTDSTWKYPNIQKYPDGWYRCSVSTTAFGAGSYRLYYYVGKDGNTFSYSGDQTSGINVWGAQIEGAHRVDALSGVSSYIPTYGSVAASRGWDYIEIGGSNFYSIYNSYKSTIFCAASKSVKNNKPSSYYQLRGNNVSTSGINCIGYETVVNCSVINDQRATPNWQSVATFNFSAIDTTELTKSIFAVEANNFATSVNGRLPLIDNEGLLDYPHPPYLINIGVNNSSAQSINGHISRFTYYPHRLSNDKLQELTTTTTKRLTYNGTPLLFNDNIINITI